jgi:hypothetical protein
MHTVAVEEFGSSSGIRHRALLESALAADDGTVSQLPPRLEAATGGSLVDGVGQVNGIR